MKLGLLFTTVLLGASAAHASTVVLAECRGSVVQGSIGEIYTIERDTAKSEITVNSQYENGYSIKIPLSKNALKINSAETLQVTSEQGFAFNY